MQSGLSIYCSTTCYSAVIPKRKRKELRVRNRPTSPVPLFAPLIDSGWLLCTEQGKCQASFPSKVYAAFPVHLSKQLPSWAIFWTLHVTQRCVCWRGGTIGKDGCETHCFWVPAHHKGSESNVFTRSYSGASKTVGSNKFLHVISHSLRNSDKVVRAAGHRALRTTVKPSWLHRHTRD